MTTLQLSTILSPTQLLGYLAMALSLSFGAVTSDRMMRALGVGCCVVWAWHYYLLGIPAAAWNSALIGAGVLALAFTAPAQSTLRRSISLVASCALFVAAYNTWSGAISVFLLVAALISTLACGALAGSRARVWLMVSDGCWLVTGVLAGSIGGVISGLLAIILKLHAVYRIAHQQRAPKRKQLILSD